MGYQESFLFVNNKKDLVKLCRVLNHCRDELVDFVSVYGAGKCNLPIHLLNPFADSEDSVDVVYRNKCYFVWWGGERHPIQSGSWLDEYIFKYFGEDYVSFNCVFVEYINETDEMLDYLDQSNKNIVQRQDIADVIVFDTHNKIDLKILKEL